MLNLSICNDPKYRYLPFNMGEDWFDSNPSYLENLVGSKCRPVILAVYEEVTYKIFDWLYDTKNYLDKFVLVLPGGINVDDMLSDTSTARKRKTVF